MKPYSGRFAPTPSGPLHFGSMVAAIGSFCDARSNAGMWRLRIDDLDGPRVAIDAVDSILRSLEAFALEWDGEIVYQSSRSGAYHAALHRLRNAGHVFACACSRKEITGTGTAGQVYPGTCRNGLPHGRPARALRLHTQDVAVSFDDWLHGSIARQLARDIGDFVLYRADGVYAYHLACALDDAEQGVTHVVRGADLIDSTPPQIYLQRLLGLSTPAYLHLPVALGDSGVKLSKQTLAQAVNNQAPARTIHAVLDFLGQEPPVELAIAPAREAMEWAKTHWSRARLPHAIALKAPALQRINGAP